MIKRALLVAILGCTSIGMATAADWPVFGHDAARSGVADDALLTSRNVATLRVRWRAELGDVADAAPIVVGTRVFVTRRDGTTVAIDAGNGSIVWRFATHGPNITSSVPAYDAQGRALYVPGVDGAIHKLDPATGQELREDGFPATITLATQTEKDASSLNLAAGYVYAQTAGYIGDATPYVGHVVAVRLRDGDKHVFNTLCSARHTLIDPGSCDAQRAGMWARAGVVVDPDPAVRGRIYAATGNAPFDASAGDYGDSIVALSADANRLIDSFTPENFAALDTDDLDMGSSSPALLPRQPTSATPLLAVHGGKDSTLRLFDRTRLGGLGGPLQSLRLSGELFSAPAIWTDRDGTTSVFLGLPDGVYAYRLATVNRKSRLTIRWHAPIATGNQGTSPIVDGDVVFVATSGQLVALDARDGHLLWSNPLGAIHWQSPAIADGVVYCADNSGTLTAFGLAQ
jgi:outer membrane protein assembly factor BamB